MRYLERPPYFAIGILLLTSIVWLGGRPRVFSLAQSSDDGAIRALAGRLFDLYQREDLDGALSLWSERSPFLAENRAALQREFAIYQKIAVKGIDIRQVQIDGDRASLQAATEMALTVAEPARAVERIEKRDRTVELASEGGVWKIWKFVPGEAEPVAPGLVVQTSPLYASQVQRAFVIDRSAYQPGQPGGGSLSVQPLLTEGDLYGAYGPSERLAERPDQQVLEYHQRRLKMGEELGSKELIAGSLIGCGDGYQLLGDSLQAIKYYEQSLKPAEEIGSTVMLSRALNNLGMLYRGMGNYAKALELLLRCLKLRESSLGSGGSWTGVALALYNIAGTVMNQGNTEHALMYYQRAFEAAEKAVLRGEKISKMPLATTLRGLGNIHALRGGRNSPALDYFQKSLKVLETVEDSDPRKLSLMAQLKIDIGLILESEKSTAQAIAHYNEALKLAERMQDRPAMINALWILSNTYLSRGEYSEALALAERSVKIAEDGHNLHTISRNLVTVAKVYRKLGRPQAARRALAAAIDLTERLRGQLAGGELDRQRSFEGAVAPYQAMIDLEVDHKRYAEAFSYAQRAKGRTLLELLQNGRAGITSFASTAELELERQLNREVVSINRRIAGEELKSQPDKKRLAELEEQLKRARLEFEAFQTTLYASHPELKEQRGEIRPISQDDAVELIPDTRTALLDFVVTSENIQLFVLTKDGSIPVEGKEGSIPVTLNPYTVKIERRSLAEMVERFRRRLANKDFDFQKLSRELYGLLLEPARKQLQGKTSLIISPDGVLWDLPFQVLQSPEGRYLIEDAAISYAPSLSVLREMRLLREKRPSPAAASLLALGNPELRRENAELARFALMDEELQSLPEAAKQVEALGGLYGKAHSRIYIGPAAREEVVKTESAGYRILHLAAHGKLDDVSPTHSLIVLSQAPGKSDEDGLLEAWEIMNLNLNADLVVLSACETARGRVSDGEGVIGLTWALFVAGCPTTVVSQWKVESSSTTELMVNFHKGYKTRFESPKSAVSTAEALRQSALRLMKDPQYRHPFFWGGFVVVGDGR